MNILLIAMPDRVYDMDWAAKFPNLGLMSLAGNLSDCNVSILDLVLKPNIKTLIYRTIKKAIFEFQPEVIGLSAMTFQYNSAVGIAKFIKNLNPRIKTILGGYHATLAFEEICSSDDSKYFDYVVRGEGEYPFKELTDALKNGRPEDISLIKNVSYKQNGTFIHNETRELTNLENIQFPNRRARILGNFHFWGIPGDVVETSRGCTMNCKFCCITRMYGRKQRLFPIERVIADIADAKASGARYIFFTDDNITLNLKRFDTLLNAIIESGHNDIKYVTQASCEGIGSSEALVRKMKSAGFDLVFLGMENVIGDNLEYLGKKDIIAKTERAIEYLNKYKIITTIGVIAGNPDDTALHIKANLDFLKKMKCYSYQRFVLTPHLGTIIRKELQEQNLIVNKYDYSKYDGFTVNVRTKHLSRRRLEWVIRWEQIKGFPYGIFISKNLCIRRYPRYFFTHLGTAILAFTIDTVKGLMAKNS